MKIRFWCPHSIVVAGRTVENGDEWELSGPFGDALMAAVECAGEAQDQGASVTIMLPDGRELRSPHSRAQQE